LKSVERIRYKWIARQKGITSPFCISCKDRTITVKTTIGVLESEHYVTRGSRTGKGTFAAGIKKVLFV
jgi:hypothetical protein